MSTLKDETQILLDADVIIHFVKGSQQLTLPLIFPGRLIMLDKVRNELMTRSSTRLPIENFLNWCKIPVIAMPADKQTVAEYARLIKTRGQGESACMAVARFHKKYIASSNLRDIKEYCAEHGITYFTTMEILEEAMVRGVLTEIQCDRFITLVISKNSKLPVTSMAAYMAGKKPAGGI